MKAYPQPTELESPAELTVLNEVGSRTRRVVLVGQPNVGKSLVFSNLTSRYVTVSNYPGTTVEVFRGRTRIEDRDYEILDTPGINGTEARSEDERVAVSVLETEEPDVIVQVADAKNLRRALMLTAQLGRLGCPMVLVLNMMDECHDKGIFVDAPALSKALGIPVVETVATTGAGLDLLRQALDKGRTFSLNGSAPREWVEGILTQVRFANPREGHRRALSTDFLVLASLVGVALHLGNYLGPWLSIPSLAGFLEQWLGEDLGFGALTVSAVSVLFAYLAPVLVPVLWAIRNDPAFAERFGIWARRPWHGLLILATTLSLTYQLVGNLGAQVLVELLEEGLFGAYLTPLLQQVIPAGFVHELLVGPFGLVSMGLAYGLAIVLPVVSTFFIAFSFLEDSGYLPRLSILSDRFLRSMGLHGKAFLPMVLGLGCVTMATMTTRVLNSRKERFIATFLLALGVPCSAQLGVILGITSGLPVAALLVVFGTVFLQLVIVGSLLSRIYPGNRSSFILELPPIRFPVWSNILRKTSLRVFWFLREALPLFVLGTLLLFVLDRLHWLDRLVAFFEPVVTGLLGLPGAATSVFLMGFLRRDYGAAGLFDMSRQGLLDTTQIIVGLVVLTLFVPCIANFFVMIKEQGLKAASLMVIAIFTYALLTGTGLNWLLRNLPPSW